MAEIPSGDRGSRYEALYAASREPEPPMKAPHPRGAGPARAASSAPPPALRPAGATGVDKIQRHRLGSDLHTPTSQLSCPPIQTQGLECRVKIVPRVISGVGIERRPFGGPIRVPSGLGAHVPFCPLSFPSLPFLPLLTPHTNPLWLVRCTRQLWVLTRLSSLLSGSAWSGQTPGKEGVTAPPSG